MRSMYLKSFALLVVLGLSSAMAFGQTAVDSLKSRLVNQSVSVKIEGLRISRGLLFKAVDIRIQDGVIQKRLISTNTNTDEILNPGDRVRVTKVEASSDKKNDFLRLTIAAADGPTVPIAFIFTKGTLATQDESQLEQVIGTTLDLSSLSSPALPAIAPPPPPPDSAPVSSTAPTEWRVTSKPVENQPGSTITHAMISGTGVAGGRSDSVVLDVSCTEGGSPTTAAVTAHIRVRRSLMAPTDFDCGAAPEGFQDAYIALGAGPEEKMNLCEVTASQTAPYDFELYPSEELLRSVVATPGEMLKVRIHEDKIDNLTATFTLPLNPAPLIPTMDRCFKLEDDAAKRHQASVVASCPKLSGLTLQSVVVLKASGRPLPADADEMNENPGESWTLPKAKAGVPPAKLTLQCGYGDASAPSTTPPRPTTQKRFPISPSATYCTHQGNTAECTR